MNSCKMNYREIKCRKMKCREVKCREMNCLVPLIFPAFCKGLFQIDILSDSDNGDTDLDVAATDLNESMQEDEVRVIRKLKISAKDFDQNEGK